ncbi:hypothetical protein AWZ03_009404 [Drosophila navojoa]|uniref:trypsin n=1 Tax=Drosophila navojoa TaxID=7232 RepID=A0A484B6A6_DRONA|nr:chymotrypsin-1 [Drosophila navojoa]TDG44174.1 hypothetical protein AWZ03_009404 [Drosophila navojoa]
MPTAKYQLLVLNLCLALLQTPLAEAGEQLGFQLEQEQQQQQDIFRINGGQLMNQSVPYQVSMQMMRRAGWRHFCSGSIVSEQHVLTAAHCVDKLELQSFSVLAGVLNWRQAGQRHRIVAKHVHPQYSMSPRIVYDIALLQVSPPFQLQHANISTIHLGDSERIGRRIPVRLTGWGSTLPSSTGAQLPDRLQVLDYRTISNEECAKRGFRVTPNEICALSAPGRGACMGDSGGPLILASSGGSRQQQLVGIVSYGSSTCAQGKPDVYTRVSSYLPYISAILNQDLHKQ